MTHKNRNKLTTNKEVTDMALCLHDCADHIQRTVMRTNMNSYFRDRIARLVQRLTKEAIQLGEDLEIPNKKAFIDIKSTEVIAKQMEIL